MTFLANDFFSPCLSYYSSYLFSPPFSFTYLLVAPCPSLIFPFIFYVLPSTFSSLYFHLILSSIPHSHPSSLLSTLSLFLALYVLSNFPPYHPNLSNSSSFYLVSFFITFLFNFSLPSQLTLTPFIHIPASLSPFRFFIPFKIHYNLIIIFFLTTLLSSALSSFPLITDFHLNSASLPPSTFLIFLHPFFSAYWIISFLSCSSLPLAISHGKVAVGTAK